MSVVEPIEAGKDLQADFEPALPIRIRPGRRQRLVTRALVTADLVALASAVVFASLLGFRAGPSSAAVGFAGLSALAVGTVVNGLRGLYSRNSTQSDHTTADDLPSLVSSAFVVTLTATVVLSLVSGRASIPILPVLALLVLSVLLMPLMRAIACAYTRRMPGFEQRTLIVGAGAVGQRLAVKLRGRPVHGFDLVGFVDYAKPAIVAPELADVPVLGSPADLPQLVRTYAVERVMVAFSKQSHEQTVSLERTLRMLNVHVDVVPRLFDGVGPHSEIHTIDGFPLIGNPRSDGGYERMKRAIDLTVASVALVLTVPIFVILALLVKLDSPGPVLYRGERLGLYGRRFSQLKFRTMHRHLCVGDEYGGTVAQKTFAVLLDGNPELRRAYERAHKLDADPRVTRLGQFLRSTSLDELPQLINVIRGELSVVGPRPITEIELARYGDGAQQLLGIRPGLTGLWQITGRSALTYDDRVRLDLAYARARSLKLDLRILLKTSSLFTRRTKAV